jgi:hypothetical protein
MSINNKTEWGEKLEDLKCINGAMYFGSVEKPCSGRDTGECCNNEQTYKEAVAELKHFISTTIQSAIKERESEFVEMIEKKWNKGAETHGAFCDCWSHPKNELIKEIIDKIKQ